MDKKVLATANKATWSEFRGYFCSSHPTAHQIGTHNTYSLYTGPSMLGFICMCWLFFFLWNSMFSNWHYSIIRSKTLLRLWIIGTKTCILSLIFKLHFHFANPANGLRTKGLWPISKYTQSTAGIGPVSWYAVYDKFKFPSHTGTILTQQLRKHLAWSGLGCPAHTILVHGGAPMNGLLVVCGKEHYHINVGFRVYADSFSIWTCLCSAFFHPWRCGWRPCGVLGELS